MSRWLTSLVCALALAACASPTDTRAPLVDATPLDGVVGGGDASDGLDAAAIHRLPTWQLEDVQPLSPRVGQTYGVDSFGGKVVVVSLLEGF